MKLFDRLFSRAAIRPDNAGDIHSGLALRWKMDLVRGGTIIPATGWRWNMITDAALDVIGSPGAGRINAYLTQPILGENVAPTPVRRDSGATTLSQAGNTCTASGNFFVAADVGRLIKYGTGDTGAECYITGYTSATVVTVSTSTTVAAQTATVWYVNTAAILTPITGLTWSADPGAANNFSTPTVLGDVCTVTHQTVRISSAFSAAKTITEIAFTNTGANASVFDRDVIQPGVAAAANDQARVTVQLVTLHAGLTVAPQGNVGTGLSTAGTCWLESMQTSGGAGWAWFNADGTLPGGQNILEPAVAGSVMAINANFTPSAFSAISGRMLTGAEKTSVAAAYGTGNRYRDFTVLYGLAEANGTIYGVAYGAAANGANLYFVKFTTPVTKISTQTLSVTFRKSWSRVLTN